MDMVYIRWGDFSNLGILPLKEMAMSLYVCMSRLGMKDFLWI